MTQIWFNFEIRNLDLECVFFNNKIDCGNEYT